MIVISVLMQLLFGVQLPLTLHFLGCDVIAVPVLLLPVRFLKLWSWWHFAVTVV